jgi:hypothetical protein
MEKKNFGYSLKNIPNPSKKTYLKCLIDKVENVIRRMRWKAFHFEHSDKNDEAEEEGTYENFGFKSTKSPPKNDNLSAFESDMYQMVRTIEFKPCHSEFLTKLKKDAKEVENVDKVLVFADKTTNLYSMPKDDYNKLLHNNITRTYKKADDNVNSTINNEAKHLAEQLNLDGKMEAYAERKAFVTLKDHKENFRNNPKCRLINPAKSEIGLVSKKMLEKINTEIRSSTGSNQWKSTGSVIKWFTDIKDKHQCKFMKFDIVDFYPSISEELLMKSIEFAKSITNICPSEIEFILHARKSLLFSGDVTWSKKGNSLFDVGMGSYDGAEICELVGLYLLHFLAIRIGNENVGLYRDDGLAALHNQSGPQADRMRKDMVKIFKDNGLSITIDIGLRITDFLDVTFDLSTGRFYPYRKPNDDPLYINAESNHPPSIIRQLPKMISRRVSDISFSKDEFDRAKPEYEAALRDSGYKEEMSYHEPSPARRKRMRKVTWFNPPYSRTVKTNVGKTFIQLIDKHFPRHNKHRKLFNRNNTKVSYSAMPNMQSIIKQHNAKVLNSTQPHDAKLCNCPRNKTCILDGKCLKSSIVYKAVVTSRNELKVYYGLCETQFKARYNNHTKAIKHIAYRNDSELSKYVWELKEQNKQYEIAWSIEAESSAYKCGTRRCSLCLTEKLVIAMHKNEDSLLNRRDEIVSSCRHRNKFYLKNFK